MSGLTSISVNSSSTFASVGAQNQQSLQPFSNLDLSETQRTQLRSILATAKQSGTSPASVQSQIDAVLTPAQQQTLKTDLQADHGHRHHGDHEAPPAAPPTAASASAASQSTAASASAASQSTAASASAASQSTDASASAPDTEEAAAVNSQVVNLQNQKIAAQSTLNNTLAKSLELTLASSPPDASTDTSDTAQATKNLNALI